MDELRDIRWWPEKGEKMANLVMARARDIANRQKARRQDDETHLRLYSESEWRGVYGIDRRRPMASLTSEQKKNRLSINVVRNISNAATSMLVRSRPYIAFQTDGADYTLLKKCKKRERFVQAHFIREKIHQKSQARVRNGVIFGLGGTKVIRCEGKIRYENILPGEILVDEQEGIDGDPPCIYQGKVVDKLRLAEMYPKFKDQIMRATSAGAVGADSASQCIVVYAWHFRSTGAKKHDGVEALCVDGATLYSRSYKWRRFPGTFFRWEECPFGFYGTGIPAELVGKQYEINTLLRMVRDSCYFGGNLKVFLQKGSNVALSALSNTLKIPIIEHTGGAPTFAVNDVASPQIFEHLKFLIQSCYNDTGISQLDAQSQTPAATMSGRARLVHQNNESLRFKAAVERYESGYAELAEATLEAATDELEESKEDSTIIFRGHEHLETVKLSDVALDDEEEDIDVQAWSSAQLGQSPGARIEQVDFLVQNSYIPKNRGLVMMDLGNDVRAEMDIANAPYNLIDERIDRILLEGEPQTPVPYMDLEYAKTRVQLEIQRCEMRKGVPADRIDMLREFWQEVCDMILASKQTSSPGGQGGAPLPGVVPPPPDGGIPLPGASAVPPGAPLGAPPMMPPGPQQMAA